MNAKSMILIAVPVAALAFLLFFSNRTTENVRYQSSQQDETTDTNSGATDSGSTPQDDTNTPTDDSTIPSTPVAFSSKMKDENTFPKETRSEKIAALETEILSEGTGDSIVGLNSTITVNYRGWLASNGKGFDDSFKGGSEDGISFNVNGVISGWTLGTQGMKIGEVRRLFIPSDLGYGSQGAGASIPANSDLVFDVELLDISN